MSLLRDLVRTVLRSPGSERPDRRRGRTRRSDRGGSGQPVRDGSGLPDRDESPGRFGPYATTEAGRVGEVHTSYNPSTDGDPDPGEIVWTWVPYEENDGRGKDRPVLIVAREPAGTLLAVQLSSQDHSDDHEWVPIGTGPWDGEGRQSWADTSRVFRVHAQGMRREASALDRGPFEAVLEALRRRYGWS